VAHLPQQPVHQRRAEHHRLEDGDHRRAEVLERGHAEGQETADRTRRLPIEAHVAIREGAHERDELVDLADGVDRDVHARLPFGRRVQYLEQQHVGAARLWWVRLLHEVAAAGADVRDLLDVDELGAVAREDNEAVDVRE
jgi:hypothetical protein